MIAEGLILPTGLSLPVKDFRLCATGSDYSENSARRCSLLQSSPKELDGNETVIVEFAMPAEVCQKVKMP